MKFKAFKATKIALLTTDHHLINQNTPTKRANKFEQSGALIFGAGGRQPNFNSTLQNAVSSSKFWRTQIFVYWWPLNRRLHVAQYLAKLKQLFCSTTIWSLAIFSIKKITRTTQSLSTDKLIISCFQPKIWRSHFYATLKRKEKGRHVNKNPYS